MFGRINEEVTRGIRSFVTGGASSSLRSTGLAVPEAIPI